MGKNRWLAVLLVAAVAVRVVAVLALQSHLVPRSTYEHGEIAASLVEGRGFSMTFLGAQGPTSQQAPAYPFLVAAAYAIGGVERPASLLILELSQAAMGGLMVLGVYRLGRQVAPDRPGVAWASASVAAFHPTLIYAATHVQVALLAATLVAWTLVWAYRAAATGRPRDRAATGLLLGLCALADPILGLAGVGVLMAFGRGAGRTGGSAWDWRPAASVFLVAGLTMAPWVARNALVHGEFVPIKSTFGYAFWQGNCSISEGTDKVVRPTVETVMDESKSAGSLAAYNRTIWEARHTAGYIDDIALTPEFRRRLGTMTEPGRSRLLLSMAMKDIADDPIRYLQLCGRRWRYFWLFDETNPRSRVLVYRISHLGLTGLALAGLAVAGPTLRRRSYPMLATAFAIASFHALTIVSARFHVPIEPLMAVWAGIAIERGISLARARTFPWSIASTGRVEQVRVVGRLG